MHSASDKFSHAFGRYALSARIGTFSSQSSRDPLHGLARAIDARAPPADPAAGRKQRRRMSSVTLPQASAGAALFGRAVLGPLDDASRLVPPRGTFPGRLRVPMSTMRQWGICSGGSGYFLQCSAARRGSGGMCIGGILSSYGGHLSGLLCLRASRASRPSWGTTEPGGAAGVNARDRIGKGAWQNAKGVVVGKSVEDLHSDSK